MNQKPIPLSEYLKERYEGQTKKYFEFILPENYDSIEDYTREDLYNLSFYEIGRNLSLVGYKTVHIAMIGCYAVLICEKNNQTYAFFLETMLNNGYLSRETRLSCEPIENPPLLEKYFNFIADNGYIGMVARAKFETKPKNTKHLSGYFNNTIYSRPIEISRIFCKDWRRVQLC